MSDNDTTVAPSADSKGMKVFTICLSVVLVASVVVNIWQFASASSRGKELNSTKEELVSIKESYVSSAASLAANEKNLKEYQNLMGQNCTSAETAFACLTRTLEKLKIETTLTKTSFEYPYPLVYSEQGATFSLTGIALGSMGAPANTARTEGGFYQEGELVNAVRLMFKIAKGTTNAQCLELKFRRILDDEEGSSVIPNTTAYTFPDVRGSQFKGSCMASGSTADNQEVIFVVPKEETDFLFTTGSASNIFFRIYKVGEVLKFEKVLKQG